MTRSILLCCLLGVLGAVHGQDSSYIPAQMFLGFDTIFTNDTSFITELKSFNGAIYAVADGLVRLINEEPFEINYKPRLFRQDHRYSDFRLFEDTDGITWAIGPINSQGDPSFTGIDHPLLVSSPDSTIAPQAIPNMLIAAIAVHNSTSNGVPITMAYMAGFSVANQTAQFGVTAAVIQPTAGSGNFASVTAPFIPLYVGGFSEYSRTVKPTIHVSRTNPVLYVVDPASGSVFKVGIKDNANLVFSGNITVGSHIVGSTFDSAREKLYIGRSNYGTLPGSITVINTDTFTVNTTVTLPNGASNPAGMDMGRDHLYVAINGGHNLYQMDRNTLAILKYATLPWYLRTIQSIDATHNGFVYFGTNDQRSRVARLAMDNFCSTPCDGDFGYCQNTTCKCFSGYVLDSNNYSCNLNVTYTGEIFITKNSNAGEVALGLLFGVTLIAGSIGWFLLWRHKQESKPRYGAVSHHDENDNFLGDD